MKRIVLVNPNTSEALTTLMVEIARECAPRDVQIDGLDGTVRRPRSSPAMRNSTRPHMPCALSRRSLRGAQMP